MKKTVFIIMILTIFTQFLGFFRDIVLSYYYGTSYISDAYLISLIIPLTIFALIGRGVSTSYVPIYTEIETKSNFEKANKFTNNVLAFLIIICTIFVIFGINFTEIIVSIFASGFTGETLDLTIQFTQITIFGIYFSSLVYIFSQYLRIKNNFTVPALISLPSNLIIIPSIIISFKYNIMFLAIGNVIGLMSQLIFLLPFSYKKGYRFKFNFQLSNPNLQKMILLSLPVILGTSINHINKIIDRTIASNIIEGGISALNYANKIEGFIFTFVVISISTVMYPMISRMIADNNIDGLKNNLLEAIGMINILVIPSTVGLMFFADPIVTLLFGRGSFDIHAINLTSGALFFYAIGLMGYGLREVISRTFYSMQDTKTPMINAVTGLLINIILNIILSRYIGINGLALATSISGIVTALLMFWSLNRKIGSIGIAQIIPSFIKIIISTVIMIILILHIYNYILNYINSNISLLIVISIGLFIYLFSLYVMKLKELNLVVKFIKDKFQAAR